MMKDRDQKRSALKLSAANRWFPQLEVDVQAGRALSGRAGLITDVDVLSSIPDEFKGFRLAIIDCKTKAKESAVNRALWLAGVLERLKADQGFCILKKHSIELDHRLMAARLNVVLLADDEFDLYAKCTSPRYSDVAGNITEIDLWDTLFAVAQRYPKLEPGLKFTRSTYWMTDDSAEACRKTLATLKSLQPELDPSQPEHVAYFLEFCALFSRSLAIVVCHIFRAYLHPASQGDLTDALLVMLYGGREAYEHRNELFKLVKAKSPGQPVPDLSLPAWQQFVQLVRQCLDAPLDIQRTPLILREVGFSMLAGDTTRGFARTLCVESPQAARFGLFIPSYLVKAVRLPPDFTRAADDALLPLIPVK